MFTMVDPAARPAVAAGLLVSMALLAFRRASACSLAHVDLYDRTDRQALETHRHDGKRYAIGTPGHEYAVRVLNCTSERALAVVSVDGGPTPSPARLRRPTSPGTSSIPVAT